METDLILSEQNQSAELLEISGENILALASKADEMVKALNKIMKAALMVTTGRDWVMISGTPYLQESGATKVARLFGVSWQIEGPTATVNDEGFKTFYYKGRFFLNNASIEAEGSRSMSDDFFSKGKTVGQVDERDVRMSAYTNCINNGIKRLIPGLRNITAETMSEAGLDMSKVKGYTFKEGSRGGKIQSDPDPDLVCVSCGKAVSQKVASYSQSKYDAILCMDCQKTAGSQS